MKKFLIISGSPRKGNTEFILKEIARQINRNVELLLLRQESVKHCLGCLYCDKTKKCIQQDAMQGIYKKIQRADVLILGSPNYFDNVSGLMKDFIDRTNPFYETGLLKGKKVFPIIVGAGSIKRCQEVMRAFENFAGTHKMKTIGSYCFKALQYNELESKSKVSKDIDKIVKQLHAA